MASTDYAVLVGISRYPRLGDLRGPEGDVIGFYDWLISKAGGAVPQSHVDLIRSSDYEYRNDPLCAQPMTDRVDLAFERLIELGQREGGRAGRRLYIFLAGHGFAPNVEDSALLMANADRRRLGHHIPGRPYASWFRAAALFEEVILLMDCCRRSYLHVPPRLPPWSAVYKPGGADVRHFYGFATQWAYRAREQAPAQGEIVQGVFTQALLAGLSGGARDAQGQVTAASLESFVVSQLPRLMDADEYQRPAFDYDRAHTIVFTAAGPPARTRVRVALEQPHEAVPVELLGPDFQIVARHTLHDELWEVDVAPGTYMIWAVRRPEWRKIFTVIGEELLHVRL